MFCQMPPVRVMSSLIPCRRHASVWLHLGHYAMFAVVHPALNMVFQHQMELEIAPASKKTHVFQLLINFLADHILS